MPVPDVLARELRSSPLARGATTTVAAAGALRAAGVPLTRALPLAVLAGSLDRSAVAARSELAREAREAAERVTMSQYLGGPLLFGGGAIDADFARAIVDALGRVREQRIVELGAGVSTVLLAHHARSRGASVVSVEHDATWADICEQRLASFGLTDHATVLRAPLTEQGFSGYTVPWYDPAVMATIEGPIGLLIVDGPPYAGGRERWPALEVLIDRLAPDAIVLADDGRRRHDARMVRYWATRYELELRWIDTRKGAWRLTRGVDGTRSLPVRVARAITPQPSAYGLEPVRG